MRLQQPVDELGPREFGPFVYVLATLDLVATALFVVAVAAS